MAVWDQVKNMSCKACAAGYTDVDRPPSVHWTAYYGKYDKTASKGRISTMLAVLKNAARAVG
jgi:hypothetical protein